MRHRPTLAAGLSVVVLLVGQLIALKHEAESRHVTCPEHGEQLDAANVASTPDDSGQAHWIGIDGGAAEHQDCAFARLLRTSTQRSEATQALVVTSIIETAKAPPPYASPRTVDVILIAPKTSPPA